VLGAYEGVAQTA